MNQPCKVCSEPAAGFHFGAFTCEGCKSFFGRTCNNFASLSECKNNGQCTINKKNRTICKACRLRKCLAVGMSKNGSRYGRRSNWFKIHCLLEEQKASIIANRSSGDHQQFFSYNNLASYTNYLLDNNLSRDLYKNLFGTNYMRSVDYAKKSPINILSEDGSLFADSLANKKAVFNNSKLFIKENNYVSSNIEHFYSIRSSELNVSREKILEAKLQGQHHSSFEIENVFNKHLNLSIIDNEAKESKQLKSVEEPIDLSNKLKKNKIFHSSKKWRAIDKMLDEYSENRSEIIFGTNVQNKFEPLDLTV